MTNDKIYPGQNWKEVSESDSRHSTKSIFHLNDYSLAPVSVHSLKVFSEFADLHILSTQTQNRLITEKTQNALSPSCFRSSLLHPTILSNPPSHQSSPQQNIWLQKSATRKVRACAKLAVEVIIWARIKLLLRDYRPKFLLLFFGPQKMM